MITLHPTRTVGTLLSFQVHSTSHPVTRPAIVTYHTLCIPAPPTRHPIVIVHLATPQLISLRPDYLSIVTIPMAKHKWINVSTIKPWVSHLVIPRLGSRVRFVCKVPLVPLDSFIELVSILSYYRTIA